MRSAGSSSRLPHKRQKGPGLAHDRSTRTPIPLQPQVLIDPCLSFDSGEVWALVCIFSNLLPARTMTSIWPWVSAIGMHLWWHLKTASSSARRICYIISLIFSELTCKFHYLWHAKGKFKQAASLQGSQFPFAFLAFENTFRFFSILSKEHKKCIRN